MKGFFVSSTNSIPIFIEYIINRLIRGEQSLKTTISYLIGKYFFIVHMENIKYLLFAIVCLQDGKRWRVYFAKIIITMKVFFRKLNSVKFCQNVYLFIFLFKWQKLLCTCLFNGKIKQNLQRNIIIMNIICSYIYSRPKKFFLIAERNFKKHCLLNGVCLN